MLKRGNNGGGIFVIFEMLRAGESFERGNYFFSKIVLKREKLRLLSREICHWMDMHWIK